MKKNAKLILVSMTMGIVLSVSAAYSFIYDKPSQKQETAAAYNANLADENKKVKFQSDTPSNDIRNTEKKQSEDNITKTSTPTKQPVKKTTSNNTTKTVENVQATKPKTNSSTKPQISTKQVSVTSAAKKTSQSATTTRKSSSTTAETSTRNSRGSVSSKERDLLARLVHAEAEGESFAGKIAVASVVMNRVKSGIFASTITGVVYGKEGGYYQFTPVADGRINNPASPSAYDAVDKVLSGGSNVPSKVMWFLNPSTSTSSWITENKTFYKKIGNHHFYY
jgi:N-acetylmuramoyl-L-alanine amidase